MRRETRDVFSPLLLQSARPRVQSAQRHRHLVGLRGSYVVSWRLMGSQGHARRKSARARHLRLRFRA